MRRNVLFTISLLAIIILITIQAYIINNYYHLKSKDFDLIYSKGIQDAIATAADNSTDDKLNEVFNQYALALITESNNDPSYFQKRIIQNYIKLKFDSLLTHFESNTAKIKIYIHENNLDSSFHSHYAIQEIQLLNFSDYIPVYSSIQNDSLKEKGLYINSYYKEGNFYAIRYEYYIDFTKKHRIILAEMRGLFIIIISTIIVVASAFIFTLYSWNKQKKLSEIKGDFIDNITHEFKTPLSSISVAISSLKHPKIRENNEKYADVLKTLEKQNWYLTEMIDHVIDVSLLDRNSSMDKKKVLLKPYLHDTVKTFLECNPGKNISITENYSFPDDYFFNLDQVQFSRVINNLLSNSVKYCIKEPEINITATLNKCLFLEFSDNGIGIKEEHQKDVFNKFYRVKNTIKTKGLGLGLYIVKKIVENHQGTIQLISKPDVGTKINISLQV